MYQDKETWMDLSQAFCQYVFHRVRSMLTSSASSAKEGLMGILMLPLERREGRKKGSSYSQRLKWTSDVAIMDPFTSWKNLGRIKGQIVLPLTFQLL